MERRSQRTKSRLGLVSATTVAIGQAVCFGFLAVNTNWASDSCDGPAGNSAAGHLVRNGPYLLFAIGILAISWYGLWKRESAVRIGIAVVSAVVAAIAVGFLLTIVYYVASGCAKG